MGEDPIRVGFDWIEEERADRIGTGLAPDSSRALGIAVGVAFLVPLVVTSPLRSRASSCAAFLFFRSIDIGSPGRTWARAPVDFMSVAWLMMGWNTYTCVQTCSCPSGTTGIPLALRLQLWIRNRSRCTRRKFQNPQSGAA